MVKTKTTPKVKPKVKHTKKNQPGAVGVKPRAPGQPSVRSEQLRKAATTPVWQKRTIPEKWDKDNKIVPDNEGEFICDSSHTHPQTYPDTSTRSHQNILALWLFHCADLLWSIHAQSELMRGILYISERDKVHMWTLWTGKKSYQVLRGWLRPSTFALKEIRAFQQCTDLLIPKKPFLRWVVTCILNSLDSLDSLDHCWCTHALVYDGLFSRQSRPFSTVSTVLYTNVLQKSCSTSLISACMRLVPKAFTGWYVYCFAVQSKSSHSQGSALVSGD